MQPVTKELNQLLEDIDVYDVVTLLEILNTAEGEASDYEMFLKGLHRDTLQMHCLALDLAYAKQGAIVAKINSDWAQNKKPTPYAIRHPAICELHTIRKMRQIAFRVAKADNEYFYILKYFKETAKQYIPTSTFEKIEKEALCKFKNYRHTTHA